MALVVELKKGEAVKIGSHVLLVSATRGARLVLNAPKEMKIERLGVVEVNNGEEKCESAKIVRKASENKSPEER
jgi:sRNA-binding carbon storage regulator CsrA